MGQVVALAALLSDARVWRGQPAALPSAAQPTGLATLDAVLPASWRVEVPLSIEKRASFIKFGILAGVIAYYLVTHNLLIYQFTEPFWMFGFHGSTAMWIGLAVLLVATVFVRNVYCRFLCPVGAALGVLSNLTLFRIKRWKECITCKT